MIRLLAYALALSLLANIVLYALWQHDAGENARNQAKAGKQQIQAMREANTKRDALAKWYAELRRKLPKVQRTVADAARDNPSNCSVSQPVFDELSRGIDEGNAARRAAYPVP